MVRTFASQQEDPGLVGVGCPKVEQEVGCILISGRGWMENYSGLLYSAELGWLAFSKRDTFQKNGEKVLKNNKDIFTRYCGLILYLIM